MTQTPDLTGPHWAFSLAVYGEADVPASCLLVQDRYGVDVNVLLLGLYATTRLGAAPDRAGIATLDRAARPLREGAVVPLRSVRRFLKDAPYGEAGEKLRNHVKKEELMAEQLEQVLLAASVAELPGRMDEPRAVAGDIVRFYAAAGNAGNPDTDDEAQRAVSIIADAAARHGTAA